MNNDSLSRQRRREHGHAGYSRRPSARGAGASLRLALRAGALVATGALVGVGALACGDDDPSPPAPSGPSASGAAGEGAGGTSAQGGAGGAAGGGQGGAAAAVGVPRLERVEKMAGNLHVFWAPPDGASCGEIEGERKTGDAPYAVIFRVPGSTRDRHDGGARADATYTYRLRCLVGEAASAYSNEMSGNPVAP
jgi:hypothetical protein